MVGAVVPHGSLGSPSWQRERNTSKIRFLSKGSPVRGFSVGCGQRAMHSGTDGSKPLCDNAMAHSATQRFFCAVKAGFGPGLLASSVPRKGYHSGSSIWCRSLLIATRLRWPPPTFRTDFAISSLVRSRPRSLEAVCKPQTCANDHGDKVQARPPVHHCESDAGRRFGFIKTYGKFPAALPPILGLGWHPLSRWVALQQPWGSVMSVGGVPR